MTIHVQRKGGRVVSEVLLYGLDIIAVLEGGDGEGMAQIVKARVGITGIGNQLFEIMINRLRR